METVHISDYLCGNCSHIGLSQWKMFTYMIISMEAVYIYDYLYGKCSHIGLSLCKLFTYLIISMDTVHIYDYLYGTYEVKGCCSPLFSFIVHFYGYLCGNCSHIWLSLWRLFTYRIISMETVHIYDYLYGNC